MIRFQGASVRYETGTLALEDFNLDVDRGEIVALLGPSGCGKSTALRLAAGLLSPSAGTVTVDLGPDAGPQPVAFVFQDATLLPWRRIRGNVGLPLELRGDSDSARRSAVDTVLRKVGLEGFADDYPRELSGGMRMRAGLARALVTRPRVMLLDEPFAALDEMTRERLQEDLLALQAESRFTVLFVTHSVAEATWLADRVVVLTGRPGRVCAVEDVTFARPRTNDLRAAPEFNQQVGRIAALLRKAT